MGLNFCLLFVSKSQLMQKEDSEILSMIQKEGQFELGFQALVDAYKEPLYWHIRRMVLIHEDADDVLQNVFIKVYKHIKNFREEAKLYTWLYRIASNESISFLRKRKRTQEVTGNVIVTLQQDPYFTGDQIQIALKEAIEKLPTKQKQVFIMRYYDEIPYKEMAEVLESSVGSLKASYHHAVKKIENYITNIDVIT